MALPISLTIVSDRGFRSPALKLPRNEGLIGCISRPHRFDSHIPSVPAKGGPQEYLPSVGVVARQGNLAPLLIGNSNMADSAPYLAFCSTARNLLPLHTRYACRSTGVDDCACSAGWPQTANFPTLRPLISAGCIINFGVLESTFAAREVIWKRAANGSPVRRDCQSRPTLSTRRLRK